MQKAIRKGGFLHGSATLRIHFSAMDVFYQLGWLLFVWNEEKAASNVRDHEVTFETAAEVFLDALLKYEDASVPDEVRTAAIGRTLNRRLLLVVHLERDDSAIRIISARDATSRESSNYQNRRTDR
jgi:uncharacterized DUF497 family protein